MIKFPSLFLHQDARGMLLAVCLEYLFIHRCILYTLLYILQEGKPAKGFSIFRFVLGRLLNSYAFMQRMPAKIYMHVCIHSTDTGIIARFSAMSNTKLQFSQHGVVLAGKRQSPSGLAGSASSPGGGAFFARASPARKPPHASGEVVERSDDRRGFTPSPPPRTLSPYPAPPGRCSSVSSPRPRRGSPHPDQTTSHSRSPTAAR